MHLVGADQRELDELFGGEIGDEIDKFALCDWYSGPHDVPVLAACRRRMIVEVLNRIEFGDHLGLVAEMARVIASEDVDQLQPSQISDMEAGHKI